MKSDYDEIIREAFSEKIEVPTEYQQKLKETLKQAHITSPQEERPMNKFSRAGGQTENFSRKHKMSVKTCLPLVACICACLALIIVLSVLLKQEGAGNDFKDTQYIKISATPAATENTVTADNSLQTEIPADTESPRRAQLPLTETTPALTTTSTHAPKKKQKNDTDVAQTKNNSKSGNRTTASHKKDTGPTSTKNKATHSPELAQVQTSDTSETIETPQETATPENIEKPPEKTKTPDNSTPQPTASVAPNSATMLPTAAKTPTETPSQASPMPSA